MFGFMAEVHELVIELLESGSNMDTVAAMVEHVDVPRGYLEAYEG